MLEIVPPGLVTSTHHSKVCCAPSASIAVSTPMPPVSARIRATGIFFLEIDDEMRAIFFCQLRRA